MKEYETYLEKAKEYKEREELILTIKDLETFEEFEVKAMIARSLEALPGGERLWVRYSDTIGTGQRKEPWVIKIIEKIEEKEEEFKPPTKKRMGLGERRGFMLESMIAEKEKRDKK